MSIKKTDSTNQDTPADGIAAEPAGLATLESMTTEAEQNDAAIAAAADTAHASKAEAVLTEKERLAGAEMMAMVGVGAVVGMVQKRYPYVEIGDTERTALAERAAPLLIKHGGEMPAWLLPYKEEFAFGLTLAGTMFGVVMQIQAHNAELLAQEQAKAAAQAAQNRSGVDFAAAGAH